MKGQVLCRVDAASLLLPEPAAMQSETICTTWPGNQDLLPGVDSFSSQADVIREGPGNSKQAVWSWALHAFKEIVHYLREKLQL